MSIVSSNMISKHYCPKCDSFDLLKLHRNYIQKHILGSQNKLQCRACGEVLKNKDFESNIPREVPVFLETVTPTNAAVPDKVAVSAETAKPEAQTAPSIKSDFQLSEDDFSVTETRIPPSPEVKEAGANVAPPEYYDDERLVDEMLIVKEKKAAWPYVTASLLALGGAAYAYIWMPMSINAQENTLAQMDMSISQPTKAALDVIDKVAEERVVSTGSPLPSVVELSGDATIEKTITPTEVVKADTVEPVFVSSVKDQLTVKTGHESTRHVGFSRTEPDSGTKADRALGGLRSASPATVAQVNKTTEKSPNQVKTIRFTNSESGVKSEPKRVAEAKVAIKAEPMIVSKSKAAEAKEAGITATTLNQPRMVKLSDAREQKTLATSPVPAENSIKLVKSATSTTTDSQRNIKSRVVTTNDIVREMQASKPIKLASETTAKPDKTIIVSRPVVDSQPVVQRAANVNKTPSPAVPLNKKAAALLGVSASELKALASSPSSKVQVKTLKPDAPMQKKQTVQSSDLLLEKVAVKFIQQDLDKLLPN